MAAHLNVIREGKLPPHAWLLQVSSKGKDSLWCGDNVDLGDDSFFEGAWAGPFEKFDFSDCANVFGSGAVRNSGGWLLVPPSHILEAIYILRTNDGGWVASNSIAFVKQFTGFEFLSSKSAFTRSFIEITRGFEYSPVQIKTSKGEFYILHHHNAHLGSDGLIICPKPLPPNFADYADYRDYLADAAKAVAANANAPARGKTFSMITSLSKGYDSPACASIARTVGCTRGVTFITARGGDSDDGTEIGEMLGMDVLRLQTPEIAGESREFTAEMYATGMQGVELVCEPLRGRLSQSLFFTGYWGGVVWSKSGTPSSSLVALDISGTSLGEFRLSEGFIHFPLPFVGAVRHADIKRISNSDELQAFSIGGWYDRPIPRRMAEEAGVPRGEFGQRKNAIAILAFQDLSLLRKEYREEIENQIKDLPLRKSLAYRIHARLFRIDQSLQWFFIRLSNHLPIGGGTFRRIISSILLMGRSSIFVGHSHPFNALAFNWALAILTKRYDLTRFGSPEVTQKMTVRSMPIA